MKKFICIVLLVVLAAGFCAGCKREPTLEEIWDSMVDQEEVDKRVSQINNSIKMHEAELKGDTYCPKCDKYMEGRSRICKYCGQYID